MSTLHGWLGALLVALFAILMLWGLALRVLGRDEAPTAYWGVQHWTENLRLSNSGKNSRTRPTASR